MKQDEFNREFQRLRNHFGERHYSGELIELFWNELQTLPVAVFRKIILEAIATRSQSQAPLLDHFRASAKEMNVLTANQWKYFEVDDCLTCGGCGWHWMQRKDGVESVAACDDCRSGKNMQAGPKGTMTITMKQVPGCTYLKPGRRN